MFLLISSFLAGVLTSLAPCILPLLPVIVGSSILTNGDKKQDKLKPYVISLSLAVSVIAFTLLLKVSTLLIGVDPKVWLYISGGIVVLLGASMLFPTMWVQLSAKLGLEHSTNTFLAKAYKKNGLTGAILTGAALGPVFSSCSPVYALILATVLPVNLALGMIYIVAYAAGLGLALLIIALAGRRFTSKIGWIVDPDGIFRKVLAVILIAVGLLIISGYDKKFQAWASEHTPLGLGKIEEKLIPETQTNSQVGADSGAKEVFNVKPYPAPELQNIQQWINSDPQSIASLKGKVVLIDFWTYSCINCIRTQPYLNDWYTKYEKDGFIILGIHAPEFAFEKIPNNVEKAVADAHIKYPVGLDNNFATWQAYNNRFWPAKYLIDKDGQVRYTHFGEGEYDKTESVIQALLKESGKNVSAKINKNGGDVPVENGQTPETYLNYERGERFANLDQFSDKPTNYTVSTQLKEHEWSLGGLWQIGGNETSALSDSSVLRVNFSAKEVYLVMDGPKAKPVTLALNSKKVTSSEAGGSDVDSSGNIYLNGARLYKLIKLPKFEKNQILDIVVPQGSTVNAFTFGG